MVFLLAIIGMICWGIAPIFVKLGLQGINPLVGLAIRTVFTAGLISFWMIADGSITQIKNISLHTVLILALEALFATLIGDFAYFAAIKKGSVSVVTIIMSSSPLVTLLCSIIFFGEKITMMRLLGSGLIIAGIAMIL